MSQVLELKFKTVIPKGILWVMLGNSGYLGAGITDSESTGIKVTLNPGLSGIPFVDQLYLIDCNGHSLTPKPEFAVSTPGILIVDNIGIQVIQNNSSERNAPDSY
jgi:hypothetical protein